MVQPADQSTDASGKPAPSRRGRPTAERVAAIDAEIRAAALELFVELGFEAASMDAIAAAAKVSKGTLYARYESKEPLFRAILEQQLEEWGQRSSAQTRPVPEDLEARLRQYARAIVKVQSWPEFRRIATLLTESARAFPDLAREWDEIITRRSVEALQRDMAAYGDPNIDWSFFAQLFHSAISGWHRAESGQRHVEDEEIVAFSDKVIDVILASIGSVPVDPALPS
ncbi:TetR/AcrR family transcriptional regulator [Novosphingobium sp. PS1R-30]|uniref:TetR/AcrR family transcriptional regulator n=1 Tax=Novosphingobium anseongense TaxID=3133436 RepID=A0ABU8RUZ7_9SPHN